MAIAKQAFYEGAALYLAVRNGDITRIQYEAPFFLLNDSVPVLLKYSTKGHSPWAFTFFPDEQAILRMRSTRSSVVVGLICGADGVAALTYEGFATIATLRPSAIRVTCYRRHGEQYEVNGPDGTLDRKVPQSMWSNMLRHSGESER